MPLIKCVDAKTGESGWKWGENGIRYFGEDAKEKALLQGSKIENAKKAISDSTKTSKVLVIDSGESDHDLLIRLDENVKTIKENMIQESQVREITAIAIKTHCKEKHKKSVNDRFMWSTVFKFLTAAMPFLGSAVAIAYSLQ